MIWEVMMRLVMIVIGIRISLGVVTSRLFQLGSSSHFFVSRSSFLAFRNQVMVVDVCSFSIHAGEPIHNLYTD